MQLREFDGSGRAAVASERILVWVAGGRNSAREFADCMNRLHEQPCLALWHVTEAAVGTVTSVHGARDLPLVVTARLASGEQPKRKRRDL